MPCILCGNWACGCGETYSHVFEKKENKMDKQEEIKNLVDLIKVTESMLVRDYNRLHELLGTDPSTFVLAEAIDSDDPVLMNVKLRWEHWYMGSGEVTTGMIKDQGYNVGDVFIVNLLKIGNYAPPKKEVE